MILLMSLMMTAMPVMAIAAESLPLEIVPQSGPVAVDSLVHMIGQLDIGGWLKFAFVVWGFIVVIRKAWRDEVSSGKKSRWEFIISNVPGVHGLAQKAKILGLLPDKAVGFVNFMDKLLKAAGHEPIADSEKESVQDLGSGYHQEFKMVRKASEQAPLIFNVSPKLLKDSETADGKSIPLPPSVSDQSGTIAP